MRLSVLLIVSLLVGCSSAPPQSDAVTARSVLESCLDAWKAGESAKSLQNQDPPIYIVEDQWNDQTKLLNFKIADSEELSGASVRFDVELNYSRKKETVRYVVTTSPALTVARLESQ